MNAFVCESRNLVLRMCVCVWMGVVCTCLCAFTEKQYYSFNLNLVVLPDKIKNVR